MAVKSGKNTNAVSYFQAVLRQWVESSGKKKNELAASLGISPSSLGDYLTGTKVPSLAQMEGIAEKTGKDISDMLAEGRAILHGVTEEGPVSLPFDNERKLTDEILDVYRENRELHIEKQRLQDENDKLAERVKGLEFRLQRASELAARDGEKQEKFFVPGPPPAPSLSGPTSKAQSDMIDPTVPKTKVKS